MNLLIPTRIKTAFLCLLTVATTFSNISAMASSKEPSLDTSQCVVKVYSRDFESYSKDINKVNLYEEVDTETESKVYTISMSTEITNPTETDIPCTIYTALYTPEGKIKACVRNDVVFKAGETTVYVSKLECNTVIDDTLKNFIWQDLKPLCSAASKLITEQDIVVNESSEEDEADI